MTTNTARPMFPWQKSATPPAAPPVATITAAPVERLAMTVGELAKAIGVSVGTVLAMSRRGDGPPSAVLPQGRLRRYPVDGVRRWLADLAAAQAEANMHAGVHTGEAETPETQGKAQKFAPQDDCDRPQPQTQTKEPTP
ncbi:MAG: hypothetical protein NTY19_26095 [Planctomycetota bacterium]|nr:hypothetical protein [Planctomycetota bacterium]